jgi:predicted nuclease of restriction endonuclease-like (RecB) superfamily
MVDLSREHDDLYERVARIIEAARRQVARTINTAMVHAYWLIGREIVEVEQKGQARAEYGEQLVRTLASRLTTQYGRGFSYPSVKRMKQFYLTFPRGSAIPDATGGEKGSTPLSLLEVGKKGSTPLSLSAAALPAPFPPLLSWSHYLVLLRVQDDQARAFYEIETAREGWSVRELERQIASLLYERLARSRDKDHVLALAKQGQQITKPTDVIKDPFVLEFLGLEERASWLERDLEQAIIDRLELFLLELGKGFCFVARQKRVTLDGDHFFIDLVFYNRLLRCFVLIDLKLGKLTHEDLGQMQMYVNYFDRYQREEHEEPTVGIVLCSDKNDAMVKITLPEDNQQIHASRYQLYLPTEEELREELEREREEAERALRLTAKGSGDGKG